MKNLILAIESSCDDSSIAIINKDNYNCLFHKKISQENEHSHYGGVVPELAARLHSAALPQILQHCEIFFERLCAIAVTNEPGLSVSLLSGITMAKTLALSLSLPLIAINHLKGHIYSLFLEEKIHFDMGILLVSGGHTLVVKIDEKGLLHLLAQSNDDSFGESFDKVAKMMNLGYPGGVAIEQLAQKAQQKNISFSVPLKHNKELYYSFSGLKNQVRMKLLEYEKPDESIKSEIAFGFEKAACEHILDKLEMLFSLHHFTSFGVVGGASANLTLRFSLQKLCEKFKCELKLAPLDFCSDNALMIARAAIDAFERKEFVSIDEEILQPRNTHFTRI
ncbi:tRNA (adenosine(37)-N6)-threonylcarbamoyltransferase complex transferase subunit TsaD [Campylobacter sp. MIT 21-1685]|uniref:tRNA (adenosine(37)-N6)-threonylcarbamoyltransferase complex transferase subunit TsaD n=1 Tax=unclassified Campylobacter TaxID=2593542 RepID=UPI00224AE11D|nr:MULTISPECIES: tRNA (adenosine(37)-N6)-threonylcarbamoyltransferase complex transferase subunit TsaD [unclassified Campylobacter]MCX2683505.1 tRNA (adenosine(37)-N6)-threonylcarbamoyltransferase complex transferase subunit TsaD [Campylobacter sp. MIT 21-1684]MCX2751786.1 tRNA (adenosine(37)-N6)-threonylcarbamoyltransferase complex transferase subunit TsaD [Campylobacter sp. MIT 21-1682]MCX2807987.1 tRNA (adenosine(37)-N6)-threonylcarbamoyltransferase complex transferase subunit TsaD [Campyloba